MSETRRSLSASVSAAWAPDSPNVFPRRKSFLARESGWGMAGRYTGSYLDRSNGWRAVATLADIGQASLVARIPKRSIITLPAQRQPGCSVLMNRA